MAKKLRDYLMNGGVKGRKFIDTRYDKRQEIIYEVKTIESMGLGLQKPGVSLFGTIMGSGEIYIKNLALCLEHDEYSEPVHSQTLPKCTKNTGNIINFSG